MAMEDFPNLRKIASGGEILVLDCYFPIHGKTPTLQKGNVTHMKKYSTLLAALLVMTAVTACEKKAATPATAPAAPAADAAKPADAAAPAAPEKK